jgi:hypothetical protein
MINDYCIDCIFKKNCNKKNPSIICKNKITKNNILDIITTKRERNEE